MGGFNPGGFVRDATDVIFYQDSDTALHVIDGDIYQSIGLSLIIPNVDTDLQDFNAIVDLPAISGTTMGPTVGFGFFIDDVLQRETIHEIGLAQIPASISLVRTRGGARIVGDVTAEIKVKDISGIITVDNTVSIGAQMTIESFKDAA